jgi:hypothetical protein
MAEQTSPNRFSFYEPSETLTSMMGGKDSTGGGGGGATNGLEMASLTTTNGSNGYANNLDMDGLLKKNEPAQSLPCSSFCAFLCAYAAYTCEYAPRFCLTIAIVALIIPSYLLVMGLFANPTEHFGVIPHDYTGIQSKYDFTVKDIDHWCLKGDNDSCQCEDPLQPSPRSEFRAWSRAFAGNVKQINDMLEEDLSNPDIAFLGGSVVEMMDGKWFGTREDERLKKVAKTFNKHFSNLEGTGDDSLTAIALGIAGDTVRTASRLS